MKKIGLMGAMKDEIAPLYEAMTNHREETVGGVVFYEGVLDGKDVVLCCAGMGKAQAAAATQLLCSHFCVDAVLFSGIAGNMTSKVSVGDVIIGMRRLPTGQGRLYLFLDTHVEPRQLRRAAFRLDQPQRLLGRRLVRLIINDNGNAHPGDPQANRTAQPAGASRH